MNILHHLNSNEPLYIIDLSNKKSSKYFIEEHQRMQWCIFARFTKEVSLCQNNIIISKKRKSSRSKSSADNKKRRTAERKFKESALQNNMQIKLKKTSKLYVKHQRRIVLSCQHIEAVISILTNNKMINDVATII